MLYAKVTNPNAGYASDAEAVSELDSEIYYEIADVDMGSSSTRVKIVGSAHPYNSVNFTFYKKIDGVYNPHDIYSDPRYNPYLSL